MVELELETIVVIIISTIIILYLLWNIIKMKLTQKAAIKDARKDTAARQGSMSRRFGNFRTLDTSPPKRR